jgi:iron complex transport system ATP-binding protein
MDTRNHTIKLACDKLDVGYSHQGKRETILSELSLEIHGGEFICLLGPNGTGKSTLIRTLSGVQPAIRGEIKLDGMPFNSISPRERARQISIVFTDNAPIGMMDSFSFASLGRHPYSGWLGILDQHDLDRVRWALDVVGATNLQARQVAELSDGERQKVSIARALAQEANIMLLDEPTAYLDLPRKVGLMRMLRELSHQENIGMLMSTHDLDLALRHADRLWLITKTGELIQGLPEELALNGELARAFGSENLDWDPSSGSFQVHKDPCMQFTMDGGGPVAFWTKRAFERYGYGLTRDESCASLLVSIQGAEANPVWSVRTEEEIVEFNAIPSLINWIRNRS